MEQLSFLGSSWDIGLPSVIRNIKFQFGDYGFLSILFMYQSNKERPKYVLNLYTV